MPLSPAQIDRISEELKSLLRVEIKSRKLKKIDAGFYKSIVEALDSLNSDAEKYLRDQDIANYISINDRIQDIERDFKSFFQRRFEKIAVTSIYDLDTDLMNSLTGEEKEFISKLHNAMNDEYNHLLMRRKEKPPEEGKEAIEIGPSGAEEEIEEKPEEEVPAMGEEPEQEFVVVRILDDLPPIAQADRDYFLHKNDILYLPKKFAEILIKRESAIKININ